MKSPLWAWALCLLFAFSADAAQKEKKPSDLFKERLVGVVDGGMKAEQVSGLRAEVRENSASDDGWTSMSLALYDIEEFSRRYPEATAETVDGSEGLRPKLRSICSALGIDQKKTLALDATYFAQFGPSPEVRLAASERLKGLDKKMPAAEVADIKAKMASGDWQQAGQDFEKLYQNAGIKPGSPEYVPAQELRRAFAPKPQVEFTQGYKKNLNGLTIHDVPLGPRSNEEAATYSEAKKQAQSGKKMTIGGGIAAGAGIVAAAVSAPVWVPILLVVGGLTLAAASGLWWYANRTKRDGVRGKDKDSVDIYDQ